MNEIIDKVLDFAIVHQSLAIGILCGIAFVVCICFSFLYKKVDSASSTPEPQKKIVNPDWRPREQDKKKKDYDEDIPYVKPRLCKGGDPFTGNDGSSMRGDYGGPGRD
jgi:hypothetical protein